MTTIKSKTAARAANAHRETARLLDAVAAGVPSGSVEADLVSLISFGDSIEVFVGYGQNGDVLLVVGQTENGQTWVTRLQTRIPVLISAVLASDDRWQKWVTPIDALEMADGTWPESFVWRFTLSRAPASMIDLHRTLEAQWQQRGVAMRDGFVQFAAPETIAAFGQIGAEVVALARA